MKISLALMVAAMPLTALFAQSINAPLDPTYYHWVDRYEIKSGRLSESFFTAMKPYKRSAIAQFADTLQASGLALSRSDAFNLDYLANDNWEWAAAPENASKRPFWKRFYRVRSDLYHVQTPDFDLHINPVIYFSAGRDSERDGATYTNTRGVQLRGMVSEKVGFYSFLAENQAIFPQYVADRVAEQGVVPAEGFWKDFNDDGFDFFTARGYISVEATRNINLQFGHDRFFIGNGFRSLILADQVPAYLFLKLNTKVWKLNYTNLFTQLTANAFANAGGSRANTKYPHKYMAMHHLSLNITKNLNVGLFETVIFNTDSLGNDGFELGYLNPIIFYRSVEQQLGSVDNALLGLDVKWNFAQQFSLYGQVVVDEFVLENLREGNGWWGNKFGVQAGGKYIDALGIDNLDLQLEANLVRPYTYSHFTAYGNYSQYLQPLGHPLGANFREAVAMARYQPTPRLNLMGKITYAEFGTDTTGANFGGDILKNSQSRVRDFDNTVAQGVENQLFFLDFTASYQLRHNFFIDLKQVVRRRRGDALAPEDNTNYTALSLRWNIPERLHDF